MKSICTCIIFFLLIITSQIFAGTVYYVDAINGIDFNNGTSEATPWQTIAKVNKQSLFPGDKILFKRGEIWREKLFISCSGTFGNPILFGAYGNGNKPIISGSDVVTGWSVYSGNTYKAPLPSECALVHMNNTKLRKGSDQDSLNDHEWLWVGNNLYVRDDSGDPDVTGVTVEASQRDTCIHLTGKPYITLENITVEKASNRYGWGKGIYAINGSNYFTIDNCEGRWNPRGGFHIENSTNCTIQNSTAHHNYWSGIQTWNGAANLLVVDCTMYGNEQEGLNFEDGSNNSTALRCTAYQNGKSGFSNNGVTGCAFIRCVAYENGQVVRNSGNGIGFWKNNDDIRVYYCLLYNNKAAGIVANLDSLGAKGAKIYNTAMYGNEQFGVRAADDNITMKNCILMDSGWNWEIYVDSGMSITLANNCYYDSDASTRCYYHGTNYINDKSGWESASGEIDSVCSNPLFTDATNSDFLLQMASPCIDAGIYVGLTQDHDGHPVPVGYEVDIGACEYQYANPDNPIASFTAYPTEGIPPLQVSFDASASYDPDGNINSYEWDFGDNSNGSGKTISYTYQTKGVYTAKLTVTSNDEQKASTSKEIKVGTPPVASLSASPTSGKSPLKVKFDASNSYDPDGKIVFYSWDFGDGKSGKGRKVTHVYRENSTRTATLHIKDDDDFEDSASQEIKIGSFPSAKFTASPNKGQAPLKVNFGALGSKPSAKDGKIISYKWDFGDGKKAKGKKVSHKYKKTGTYVVTLKVADNEHSLDSATKEIWIYSKPKAAFSCSPLKGIAPLAVTFDGSISTDKDGKIVSYKWNFRDGKKAKGKKVSHTYYKGGHFKVTLTVIDNNGYSNSTSKKIEVIEKPYPPLDVKVTKLLNRALAIYNYVYRIEWNKNPDNEEKLNILKYRIYRKKINEDDTAYTLIQEVDKQTFMYEDGSLPREENNNTYIYAISAVDENNRESELSKPISFQYLTN